MGLHIKADGMTYLTHPPQERKLFQRLVAKHCGQTSHSFRKSCQNVQSKRAAELAPGAGQQAGSCPDRELRLESDVMED